MESWGGKKTCERRGNEKKRVAMFNFSALVYLTVTASSASRRTRHRPQQISNGFRQPGFPEPSPQAAKLDQRDLSYFLSTTKDFGSTFDS